MGFTQEIRLCTPIGEVIKVSSKAIELMTNKKYEYNELIIIDKHCVTPFVETIDEAKSYIEKHPHVILNFKTVPIDLLVLAISHGFEWLKYVEEDDLVKVCENLKDQNIVFNEYVFVILPVDAINSLAKNNKVKIEITEQLYIYELVRIDNLMNCEFSIDECCFIGEGPSNFIIENIDNEIIRKLINSMVESNYKPDNPKLNFIINPACDNYKSLNELVRKTGIKEFLDRIPLGKIDEDNLRLINPRKPITVDNIAEELKELIERLEYNVE